MSVIDQKGLRDFFRGQVKAVLGADPGEFLFEYPPRIELGDLSLPFCFALAKELRRAPRQIAQEIVDKIPPPEGVQRMEPAGAGYVNLYLDREAITKALYAAGEGEPKIDSAAPAVTVEHTSVNPNKAAHIGHIRNACLGDTQVRLFRYLGMPVRVQNYIDDTGVQVADVAVGFRHILGKGPDEVRAVPEPFDHFCWDLYARVGKFYAEDESRQDLRRAAMHAMEVGEGVDAEIGAIVADRVVHCHLRTMERLGIRYELLVWEGDILRSRFWERAFGLLKTSGSIYLAAEGKNSGCWVMDLSASSVFADMDDPDKIIVRSDGTVTYVGKDIAYHLWKFGRLGMDFRYRRYHRYENGQEVWTTASDGVGTERYDSPPAEVIYNVIDVGQEYTQKVVAESLRAVAGEETAAGFHHFAYEKVALTPTACREMGVELEEGEENKPFIAMSGRRGLGIKADDLIDALVVKARGEVASRNPDFSEGEIEEAAQKIAVGAMRYFMVKYSRNRVLAFDFNEALAFEGESGPYISYAMVRANNILGKLVEVDGLEEREIDGFLDSVDWPALHGAGSGDDTWEMLSMIARLPSTAADATAAMELSVFAKFVYSLAQKFNAWYHKYLILHEKDENAKRLRTVVLQVFRGHFRKALECLGIEAPRRM
jgi:arginyl-tRNA synthetase